MRMNFTSLFLIRKDVLLVKNKRFHFIILGIILLLAACGSEKIEPNMSSTIADFEFTNQHEETFASDELKEEWWIAYFFYTNCKMVCPQTTANILNIQDQLSDSGLTPPIIGFSVDPDFDTPAVLQEFAEDYGATFDNLTFLTGYDFETIKELSNDSFQTALDGGGPVDNNYAHSTYFFLINPKGEVIKRYDGMSREDSEEIIADLEKVM